ncbi:MAG TPA: IclR family transcriptional regulator C-terminal domain-containing protein [Burkholderiales bacterium]|nr:IclR family transcriptional regulator C-terminal domain-containing protein [Burkholderiales bacterium]
MPGPESLSRPARLRPGAATEDGRRGADRILRRNATKAAGAARGYGSDFVRALAKGLAVIEAFDARSPSMTLSEVAKKTGLSRGTARRLLLTLVDLGYAGFDGKYFGLQPRALNLGFAYLHSQKLWQLGQPYMVQLVERVHESCSIAVLDSSEIVYVARVPTSVRIMSINLGIGTRLPAFATSMGRVLLAGLPVEEVDRLLEQASPLAKYTPKTVVDATALLREIEAVRRQGWALVDQELEMGLRSIAVPIADAGDRVIAALNIGTHASRWPIQKLIQEVLPLLKDTAASISGLLAPERHKTVQRKVKGER